MRSKSRQRFAHRLIVMVKDPRAGRVKTRLARDVGTATAAALYRSMLFGLIGRVARDPRWQTILAVSPDAAIASRALPPGAARMAQGGGNLGRRLHHVAHHAGQGPVVIIGSDSPAITPADIAAAFRGLRRADAVIGPSDDGGYWLIGLRKRGQVPPVFDNVRWSSEHTLADTRHRLAGWTVGELRQLGDVDRGSDLQKHRASVGRRVLAQ